MKQMYIIRIFSIVVYILAMSICTSTLSPINSEGITSFQPLLMSRSANVLSKPNYFNQYNDLNLLLSTSIPQSFNRLDSQTSMEMDLRINVPNLSSSLSKTLYEELHALSSLTLMKHLSSLAQPILDVFYLSDNFGNVGHSIPEISAMWTYINQNNADSIIQNNDIKMILSPESFQRINEILTSVSQSNELRHLLEFQQMNGGSIIETNNPISHQNPLLSYLHFILSE